jgi:hypothetical protein
MRPDIETVNPTDTNVNVSALQKINGRRRELPERNISPDGLTVCLISALTVADFIDFDLVTETHSTTGAQLGVLTLAAILRKEGLTPHVVNLDDLFLAFLKQQQLTTGPDGDDEPAGLPSPAEIAAPKDEDYFFPFVAEYLESLHFDV